MYFPEDMIVACVQLKDLKHIKEPKPNWAKLSREEYVNEWFDHIEVNVPGTPAGEKKGKFIIIAMGEGKMVNSYKCARKYKNGKICPRHVYFDVGYVQKRANNQIFPFDKSFDP